MSNAKETKVEDHDYSLQPVPQFARRRLLTMFMIMLGFTFFSASMWTGQTLGDSLDLSGFIGSLILGGIILAIYTGSLAYVGAKTGLSLDLLAQHSFGAKGSYLPSVLTSFTQIGWFGVGVAMFAIPVAESQGMSVIAGAGLVIGSFVSGGTATPNFARFSKTALQSVIVTVVAFFIGNSLMFCFGAFSGVYVGGNDIFEVMVALNLTVFAIIVLGLNIWTTNDNALYTAGLGLSNITKVRKRPMVVISGILGTVTAVWLYNNFVGWLNILNCTLPPVGMIVVLGYFCHKEEYEKWDVIPRQVNWFAIAGVLIGAAVANLVPWGIASVNGMVIAAVCYLVGELVERKKKK